MLTHALNRFQLTTFVVMNKPIKWILILMCGSMLLLTGLQFYWNYQNYLVTIRNFKTDVNAALKDAVEKEKTARVIEINDKIKLFLADSTFIKINIRYSKIYDQSIFSISDVKPLFKNLKSFDISFSEFQHKKIEHITPKLKNYFINRYVDKTLGKSIRAGYFYYDTQRLGDTLGKIFAENKLNLTRLTHVYQRELVKRDITAAFRILTHDNKTDLPPFITLKYNASLQEPDELVFASFPTPNVFFITRMKWVIISSFLLIGITLFCFYYTVKTLFNQHKLVAIKNQFISNMTHEINTPLSSIQVTAEALKQFHYDEETREKYLDIILYQTKKLNGLSEEILENAKFETLTFTMDEEIDLNQLISNLIDDLKLKENVIFSNQENFIIKGNQTHLSRAIANVLENAFKYNDTSQPNIEIKLTKNQKEIKLFISDNGPGIADEFKEKIFEQFYRIPTGNIHNTKGYGLGLSYVKKVISQHKGTITVTDNQPKGSIFCIKFTS